MNIEKLSGWELLNPQDETEDQAKYPNLGQIRGEDHRGGTKNIGSR